MKWRGGRRDGSRIIDRRQSSRIETRVRRARGLEYEGRSGRNSMITDYGQTDNELGDFDAIRRATEHRRRESSGRRRR